MASAWVAACLFLWAWAAAAGAASLEGHDDRRLSAFLVPTPLATPPFLVPTPPATPASGSICGALTASMFVINPLHESMSSATADGVCPVTNGGSCVSVDVFGTTVDGCTTAVGSTLTPWCATDSRFSACDIFTTMPAEQNSYWSYCGECSASSATPFPPAASTTGAAGTTDLQEATTNPLQPTPNGTATPNPLQPTPNGTATPNPLQPTPNGTACSNTDPSGGSMCASLEFSPSMCGNPSFDSSDFTSNDMCCSCGGGSSATANPADATPSPTLPALTCRAYVEWPTVVQTGCRDDCTATVAVEYSQGRCDRYCASFGHVCVAAAVPSFQFDSSQNLDCQSATPIRCDQDYYDPSYPLICSCEDQAKTCGDVANNSAIIRDGTDGNVTGGCAAAKEEIGLCERFPIEAGVYCRGTCGLCGNSGPSADLVIAVLGQTEQAALGKLVRTAGVDDDGLQGSVSQDTAVGKVVAAALSASDSSGSTAGSASVKVQNTDQAVKVDVPFAVVGSIGGDVSAVVTVFNEDQAGAFEGKEEQSLAGGLVPVSFTLFDESKTKVSVSGLATPINIQIADTKPAGAKCAYWDKNEKAWKHDGLTEVSATPFVCAASHLSIFGAVTDEVSKTLSCSNAKMLSNMDGSTEFFSYPATWVFILLFLPTYVALMTCAHIKDRRYVDDFSWDDAVLCTSNPAYNLGIKESLLQSVKELKDFGYFARACGYSALSGKTRIEPETLQAIAAGARPTDESEEGVAAWSQNPDKEFEGTKTHSTIVEVCTSGSDINEEFWKRNICSRVGTLFVVEHGLLKVLSFSMARSCKARAMQVCATVAGSVGLSAMFYGANGEAKGSPSAGQGCETSTFEQLLLRNLAVAIITALLSTIPIAVLSIVLSARSFTYKEEWCEESRAAAVRMWHIKENILLVILGLYSLWWIFFVFVFLASVNEKTSNWWMVTVVYNIFVDIILMPVAMSCLYLVGAMLASAMDPQNMHKVHVFYFDRVRTTMERWTPEAAQQRKAHASEVEPFSGVVPAPPGDGEGAHPAGGDEAFQQKEANVAAAATPDKPATPPGQVVSDGEENS